MGTLSAPSTEKRLITCLLSVVFLLLGSNRGVKKQQQRPNF